MRVRQIKLLTKVPRPCRKMGGIKRSGNGVSERYLDLDGHRTRLKGSSERAKFWEANRKFMKDHGFIEVETPVLETTVGGADARPFVTHMNALTRISLRISTELFEKRLLAAGFEKYTPWVRNFRTKAWMTSICRNSTNWNGTGLTPITAMA